MRLDGKALVAGEVGELRVEFGGSQADLLHVVVEDFLRPTPEELKGVLMAAQQCRQLHRRCELDIEHAREAQDQNEEIDGEDPARRIGKTAAVGPVGLGLFARLLWERLLSLI